uniref:Claudin 4 n=1 Tax=Gouania willdenowi TaxID=441366 RepID=A0A8C5DAC6_GOUWI
MVSGARQITGLVLALIAFLGSIVACALPAWKVTAFIGANIVTAQVIWEGLWMSCVKQSTGQMQCKIYDSLLALPKSLQASRSLVVIAIIVGVFGLVLGVAGGKCTNFVKEEREKSKVAIASGVVFLVAGLLMLIPVSWTANTIIRDFYSPIITNAQRRELGLGACLYIGWGASILLILGGGMFIQSTCPLKPHDEKMSPSVRYRAVRSSNGSFQPKPHQSWVPSARSQPVGVMQPKPQSQDRSTTNPPSYTKPPWEDGPEENSERSWAPSTKSQMKRADSFKSENSEALSTKSQLKRAELEETLPVMSDAEDISTNPARTYL